MVAQHWTVPLFTQSASHNGHKNIHGQNAKCISFESAAGMLLINGAVLPVCVANRRVPPPQTSPSILRHSECRVHYHSEEPRDFNGRGNYLIFTLQLQDVNVAVHTESSPRKANMCTETRQLRIFFVNFF